jgi:hypothetical protein
MSHACEQEKKEMDIDTQHCTVLLIGNMGSAGGNVSETDVNVVT